MNLLPKICLFGMMALLLSSCSGFGGRQETSPELKAAVVSRAVDYITTLLNGREDRLAAMILWNDYIQSKGGSLDKERFFLELRELRQSLRDSQSKNPLLSLDLEELKVTGDKARVVLKSSLSKDSPEVEVRLDWVEYGWLITGDSIFGSGGLRERHELL